MKLPLSLFFLTVLSSWAFPPAPHHELYGVVRDESGNPLSGDATVRIYGASGTVISGIVDQTIAPGVNYTLKIPMDAGSITELYQSSALTVAMPFSAEVIIDGVSYLPIEVQGGGVNIGEPGGKTRMDLTLGVDADQDGLPDAWENRLIDALDGLDSLEDVNGDDDSDGDGVSNKVEYLAGTYAFDKRASFKLEILKVENGFAQMRFLAVEGRSYILKSSSDLENFESVPFSLSSDGENERSALLADKIAFQTIYVPVAEIANRTFRLHVQ